MACQLPENSSIQRKGSPRRSEDAQKLEPISLVSNIFPEKSRKIMCISSLKVSIDRYRCSNIRAISQCHHQMPYKSPFAATFNGAKMVKTLQEKGFCPERSRSFYVLSSRKRTSDLAERAYSGGYPPTVTRSTGNF